MKALCAIGQSSKTSTGYIGKKGIGFVVGCGQYSHKECGRGAEWWFLCWIDDIFGIRHSSDNNILMPVALKFPR